MGWGFKYQGKVFYLQGIYAITVFQLLAKVYELFEVSKIEQKRQLIRFVFSKRELYGKTLVFTLRKPFDLVVNLRECPSWRWAFAIDNIALSDEVFMTINSLKCEQGITNKTPKPYSLQET